MVHDHELINFFQENHGLDGIGLELRKKIMSILPQYLKFFLPKILTTGTTIDQEEPVYQE